MTEDRVARLRALTGKLMAIPGLAGHEDRVRCAALPARPLHALLVQRAQPRTRDSV